MVHATVAPAAARDTYLPGAAGSVPLIGRQCIVLSRGQRVAAGVNAQGGSSGRGAESMAAPRLGDVGNQAATWWLEVADFWLHHVEPHA